MTNDNYDLITGCERVARLAQGDISEFDYSFIPRGYIGLESLIEDLGFYYNPKDSNDISEKTRLIEEYKKQIKDLNKEASQYSRKRNQPDTPAPPNRITVGPSGLKVVGRSEYINVIGNSEAFYFKNQGEKRCIILE